MKTDVKTQMNSERPDDVLDDLEAKHGSLQPVCCAALVAKIKDARRISHDCWRAGYVNQNLYQRNYSAGQLDAFDAVLSWIAEAQHNGRSETPPTET